jgi:thioredoxin-related protein
VVFSFTLYLFAGLLGNDLKGVSSLLPPKKEKFTVSEDQPGYPYAPGAAGIVSYANALCGIPAYSGFLSLPHGIQGYFEIEEALACAREKNKPLLIDFVGHTCSNCKKMYEQVWSDPKVLEILKNDYIIVALYTDDKTRLPEKDWIISSYDGKTKNTIGKLNQDLQITRFNSNALPLYVIVDGNGKELTTTRYTYSSDVQKFIRWLEEGKKEFGSKQ